MIRNMLRRVRGEKILEYINVLLCPFVTVKEELSKVLKLGPVLENLLEYSKHDIVTIGKIT